MNLPNLDSSNHSPRHREQETREIRPSLRILGACPDEETPQDEDFAGVPPAAIFWEEPECSRYSHLRKLPKSLSSRETTPSPPSPLPDNAVARLPLGQIRMILRELDTGDYDLRTVLLNCQGHPPGSPAFRDAYLDARLGVRRSERQQRDLRLSRMCFAAAVAQPPAAGEPPPSPAFHVIHPGDLLRHFGVWVIIVCVLELWISWRIGHILDHYFLGGRVFLALLVAFAFLGLDSLLWLRFRGRHVGRFTVPGVILISALAVLAAALHLQAEIGDMLSAGWIFR